MKMQSFIVTVILTLVIAIVLMVFINSTQSAARSIADSQICKSTVEANALLRVNKISNDVRDIKCPTLFIESDSQKERVVFNTLALAMADTWREFLEGKMEIFDTDTQDYCVIRRVIEFKEPNQFNGFLFYLIANNIPEKQITFFNYLSNTKVEDKSTAQFTNTQLKDTDIIDTSNKYAVVFTMSKKERFGKEIAAVEGALLGLLFGNPLLSASTATIGYLFSQASTADWNAGILLIKYDEETLNKLDCTKLPISVVK